MSVPSTSTPRSTGRHRAVKASGQVPAPKKVAAKATAGTTPGTTPEATPTVPVGVIFRRFWPLTRPFRWRLALCLLLAAVSPGVDAASIWLFKVLIDDVLTVRNFALFPTIAIAYVVITVAGGALSFVDDYLCTWIGEQFVLRLRNSLFAHLHEMSLGFFERRQLGDLISRLSGDVNAIEQLVLSGVIRFVSFVVKLLVFGTLLFVLNWKLALLSLITVPLFAAASRVFARRLKRAAREKRRRTGSLSAVAEESLGNAALVHSYNRQAAETARFHKENHGAFLAQMTTTRLRAMFGPLINVVQVAGVLTVIGFAVWQLADNAITLGGLLVFLGYLSQMYAPIRGFGSLGNSLYAASAGAERVIEVLDEQPAVMDPSRPRRIGRAVGNVRVRALDFTYPGTSTPALSRVGFTVAPGQTLAVVGPSGAGKTTLTKLLLRFYDPDAGDISLDGIDLRRLSLADLRRNLAVVLQETLVFDGTIRDNILWGRPEATDREIVAAAEAADADTFIRALPDGYDTRVGQRGRLLSGGQRQRLAIARAMIRDAPVLLLDEPTTGLDAASAERVLAPLQRLMHGRTTIVISHNLLTVTQADEILFLEQGQITAAGTHERLLAVSPGYAQLYRLHHPRTQPASPLNQPASLALRRSVHPGAVRHQR